MVVNPDDLRVAEVRLQYMDGDGREQGGPRNIRIAARGRYAGRMSDLLPAGAKESVGYMSILSDLGLATTAFFGSPGRHESAISRDNGQSWTYTKLSIRRNEGETDLVDPDVLILDDRTFRLYTTIGDREMGAAKAA